MKHQPKILVAGLLALAACSFTASCSDDDLGPSIFDTKEYALDRNSFTFPLDTFVKVNFLEPYNMRFIYRMEYTGSDKDKNLTPARYSKSQELAVLTKYLWYDVYDKVAAAGPVFLKSYSPRIIFVVGSRNLNTSSGTETLGVTEGGTKVTLYRVNMLEPDNIEDMNEYFFETMHHEFGHILDNNRLHPTTFNMLSSGRYNAAGWSDTPDSVAASQGFISPYASASYTEDWVETLGRFITRDTLTLERLYHTAEYEWEIVDLEDKNGDNSVTPDDYNYMVRGKIDIDTIGYFKDDESGKGEYKVYRRVCARDANGNVVPGEDGKPQWTANITGARQVIEEKIRYVKEYMQEQFGINLYELRQEIQNKQFRRDADGNFLTEEYYNSTTKRNEKRMLNAITYIDPATGKNVLTTLLEEIEKYKELQNK